MHETHERRGRGSDPLADIIRTVGRRPAPPQDHYDQVYLAARQSWQQKVKSRRRNRWFALAASIAIVTGGGVLLQSLISGESSPGASIAIAQGTVEWYSTGTDSWEPVSGIGHALSAGARLRTSEDGRVALDLAAGGSLRLAENTEFVVGAEAVVLATGTLYFDSFGRAPDALLTVETSIGDVHDIGTQFEVRMQHDALRIRVREGAVSLRGSGIGEGLIAESGDEVEVSASGVRDRRTIAPDNGDWAWAEALASVPEVESRSTLAYLEWIARETGKRLEFEPDNAASARLAAEVARFNGDPAGLSPLELLSTITLTSDFYYSLTPDGAILIGRN